jgi:Leucine-rich repeat (LRR) protein
MPQSIGLLANLQELNLSNNRLREVPRGIGALGKLRVLKMEKNPFKKEINVPKSVLSKGIFAMRARMTM